ncbi:helix-turn-helix transcriptional regulator [Asticcacaulis biprosthecium]|nr:autoinducer binding domain-containing protein [Asticcacaulis biprosthecium]
MARQFGRANADHPNIQALRRIVPFDFFAMSGMAPFGLGVGRGVMLATDMPEDFIRKFLAEKLYPHDPLSFLVTPVNPWGSWHDLEPDALTGTGIPRIRALEREYGITTRTVVGFFNGDERYGGVTFCRSSPFSDNETFILEMATRVVHAELSDKFLSDMNSHMGLSAGELLCLGHFANGYDISEIEEATGYTTETIYSYSKSAAKKLGARARTDAVAEAMRRKLIA